MECKKDEARGAMNIAERKLSEKDYNGVKTFVNKAQKLYPQLDGLEQLSMMIHVYIVSAANKINVGEESDWYRILGVDPLAGDEALKKQYKKLALLLHPDKNRFHGAEGAFKLVLAAWSLLSDKAKRVAYDQKRKSREAKLKKREEAEAKPHQQEQKQQTSANSQATNKQSTIDSASSTTSASDYAKKAKKTEETMKEWFEKYVAASASTENANQAEKSFKRTTTNPNSCSEAERNFTTAGDPNSTCKAQRIFKRKWQM